MKYVLTKPFIQMIIEVIWLTPQSWKPPRCSLTNERTLILQKWHIHMCAQLLSHVRLCNPLDCRLQYSFLHGIFQTRILEWVAISFSRGSSRPRYRTCISCDSCIGRFFATGSPVRYICKGISFSYKRHEILIHAIYQWTLKILP